jgi:nitrilase
MTDQPPFKLAAIQAAPVYFDPVASAEKACHLISEAGKMGATIAAFSETWLPGYPFFVWRSDPELSSRQSGADYLAGAVEIPSPITDQLCEAALEANIDVVIGVAERDSNSLGTVYCTLLFISSEGTILGRHRKLKPTHEERTAWGEGDGSTLTVYQRPYGRISGLNCWEHNMVLPGYVLMSQGTQIHVAAWPGSSTSRHLLLSRAFASQAAAYVIDVGALLEPEIVPSAYKNVAFTMPGQSSIIGPRGEVIAGPAEGETILLAEGNMGEVRSAKSLCDVGGHYSRPDVFQLQVNRTSFRRVVSIDE